MHHRWRRRRDPAWVRFDCYGVVLIVDGSAALSTPDGFEHACQAGDVWLLDPARVQAVEPHPLTGLSEQLLLLDASWLDEQCAQFAAQLPDHPFRVTDARRLWRPDGQTIDRLLHWGRSLSGRPVDPLLAAACALDVLTMLRDRDDGGQAVGLSLERLPPWLLTAVVELAAPAGLRGGLATLVRLTGRSPNHCNKVVRERLGITATDLVNRLRLDRAARMLRLTDEPVAAIGATVGFPNQAHFHRLFRRHFNTTPAALRDAQRRRVAAWPSTNA